MNYAYGMLHGYRQLQFISSDSMRLYSIRFDLIPFRFIFDSVHCRDRVTYSMNPQFTWCLYTRPVCPYTYDNPFGGFSKQRRSRGLTAATYELLKYQIGGNKNSKWMI